MSECEMEQMDHFHSQHTEGNNSSRDSIDFPQSQELFSDQEHTENKGEGEILANPHETDASSKTDDSVLFPDQIVCPPTRPQQIRRGKNVISPPVQNTDTERSSDYEPPPRKLTMQEIFNNHFRRKRKDKRRKKRTDLYVGKHPPEKPKSLYSISLAQRKRRLLHYGVKFPFASKKHLSLKLCLAYEQYVLGGFLNYVKNLKYEKHLKKSLMNMHVSKEIEEDSFETRKFKYMDDEEPISPISESEELEEHETNCCDASIVENSSFILDCRIPSKEQWMIKEKNHSR